jgi:hypothetical protein
MILWKRSQKKVTETEDCTSKRSVAKTGEDKKEIGTSSELYT